ncbi:DUF2690 domain-containing protein [Streptomyces sp. NPDC003374]
MPRWKALPEELDPQVREFVIRLRGLVDGGGLGVAALADRTGYSRTSWERYLNGRLLAPKGAVIALAEVTGTGTDPLVTLWELAERAWSRAETGQDRLMEALRAAQPRPPLGGSGPRAAKGPARGGPSGGAAAAGDGAARGSAAATASPAAAGSAQAPPRVPAQPTAPGAGVRGTAGPEAAPSAPAASPASGPRPDAEAEARSGSTSGGTPGAGTTSGARSGAPSGTGAASGARSGAGARTGPSSAAAASSASGSAASTAGNSWNLAGYRGPSRAGGRDAGTTATAPVTASASASADAGPSPDPYGDARRPGRATGIGTGRDDGGVRRRQVTMFLAGMAGVLAVIAAVFLLTGGNSGEKKAPSSSAKSPSPAASTPVNLPAGVKCAGAGCTGKDAERTGCSGELAATARSVTLGGTVLEVRYSRICGAAWGRITQAAPGDRVQVTVGGRTETGTLTTAGDTIAYTPMIAVDDPARAKACATLASGRTACTGQR